MLSYLKQLRIDPLQLVFLTALLVVLTSLSVEHIGHITPCTLCTIQRYGYLNVCLLAGLARLFPATRGLIFLLQVVLLLTSVLGWYHFSVQMGWVFDPCVVSHPQSLEHFKEMLQGNSCAKVSWAIGGIPISLISGLTSGLLLLCVKKHSINQRSKA